MGIEEFFSAIRERCSSDDEYAVELLKARGFLLEDGELTLSDNSHPDDGKYLNYFLKKEKMGCVKDGKITLLPNCNMEKLFYYDDLISFPVCGDGEPWKKFLQYKDAPKVSTRVLEPFVARYIKAISACRVWTERSCDGNSPEIEQHYIKVEPIFGPSVLWHKILCERCLSPFFNLCWDTCYQKIRIHKTDKWKIYVELNRAAEVLYDNRIMLRQVRQEAIKDINRSMIRHMTNEELSEIFSSRANELLDKCWLNIHLPLSRYRRLSKTSPKAQKPRVS